MSTPVARHFGSPTPPLFSLGEADVLEKTFSASGLRNVIVQAVNFRRHYPSTAEMMRRLKEGAFLRAPIEKLDEPQREQAWAEIERQLGRLEGPKRRASSTISRRKFAIAV